MPSPGPTRRSLLRTASAAAGVAVIGGCGGGDRAGAGPGTATPSSGAAGLVHALDAALAVEYATLHAYAVGLPLLGSTTAALAGTFRQHHDEHRDRLIQLITGLSGTPTPAKDRYDLGTPPGDEGGALTLLASVEDQAVKALFSALRQVGDPALVQVLASIMGAESQHSAALRTSVRLDPAPDALVSA